MQQLKAMQENWSKNSFQHQKSPPSIVKKIDDNKKKPEFIEDWVSFNWRHDTGIPDDDDPRMNEFFMNKVKSPSIQKFIRDCDSWHKNRNYFKRKERKACKAKQK